MAERRIVSAVGKVPFGASVLVRGARASVAPPELANGVACAAPLWSRKKVYRDGQSFWVEMNEGLGARDLHAIANGPIMDPSEIYLPAGKLSMAETRAREAANILSSSK
jgi:hypothetical protein